MKIFGPAVLVVMFTCAGCKQAPETGKAFEKQERWVYKVNDNLHLALGPIELEAIAIDKAALQAKFQDREAPKVGFVQHFHFFVPGETSVKEPEKYHQSAPMNQKDENVVRVHIIEPWTEEMYRTNPVASRDARIGWQYLFSNKLQSGERSEEVMGMQCFQKSSTSDTWPQRDCLAERTPGEWAIFTILEIDPRVPWPTMKTKYYTKAYGGLTVAWSVHSKHADKWRQIDAKLWQLIDQWNIAETTKKKGQV